PAWLAAAGFIALLALAGVFASMAQSLAMGVEAPLGRPAVAAARTGSSAITLGALGSAAALALLGGLALAWFKNRIPAAGLAFLLAAVVGADLWRNATSFWRYSPPPQEVFRPDALTQRVTATPLPYRTLDLGVYPGDGVALMAYGIPQLLGHHGNELHRFDELMGGKNQWRNLSPQLLDLFAVRYVIAPAGPGSPDSLPGYRRVMDAAATSPGTPGRLFEQENPSPYARVVPGGAKLDDSLIVATLVDPRLPGYDRVVFFAPDAPVSPDSLTGWPEPSPSRAVVTEWVPGAMTVTLDPAPERPSYLLVAENWYPDWEAVVDGAPAHVVRGNHTLITVPLRAGARTVRLEFRSAEYQQGSVISLLSLGVVLLGFAAPWVSRRRRRA
ncbi:MAG: hypothetical protein ACREMJ_11355, partial [Gemmatimonadales bacterium]